MIESILNKDIELIIKYSFKNKENLRNSLIHPSFHKDKKNKPLKLSSSGRLQIRKNLGPSGDRQKTGNNKKTIQIGK